MQYATATSSFRLHSVFFICDQCSMFILFYFHYHFPQCFVSRYVFGSEICQYRLQGHVPGVTFYWFWFLITRKS